MKISKILGVIALGVLGLSLAACSNGNNSTSEDKEFEFFTDETTSSGYSLSSITVDTTNARTTFYIGEEFSTEGLKVSANYRKMVDGSWQSKQSELAKYSVDSSAFDSSAIGSYDIVVGYREGDIITSTIYKVNVSPSVYDNLAEGSTYVAGIKATFVDSGLYGKNNSYIREQYVKDAYRFDKTKLNFKLLTNKVLANKQIEQTESVISYVEISDSNIQSNVNYDKIGSYPIRITYKGEDITVGGKTYENKVSTFVLINVVNPVKKIEKVSTGDTSFETSVSKVDLSAWQFKITRHVAEDADEVVGFSSDIFKVTGISLLVAGNQTAYVEYMGEYEGNTRPGVEVAVSVTQNPASNITIYSDLSKFFVNGVEVTENLDKTANIDLSNNEGVLLADNIKQANANKTYDGITFTRKITIQAASKSSCLRIVMPSAGKIVLYVASTGSGEPSRPVLVKDADGEEVFSANTTQYNNPTDKFEIDVDQAGTYIVTAPGKDIYVFGVIIACSNAN